MNGELPALWEQALDELYEEERVAGRIPWNDAVCSTGNPDDEDVARWDWESPGE